MKEGKKTMKKNLLINYIKNGASLDKDLQPITKNDGFMCSILGYEKTFKPEQTEEIEKTIVNYSKILKYNQFIGVWNNDGLVYIDISKHYTNKQDAIKNGIKNKQLAIYDLKNKKDIYLTKKVYIIYKYNKITQDVRYLQEFTSVKDLEKATNKDYKTLATNYMIKSIDSPIKELLQDKYIIITENAFICDLIGD